MADSSREQSGDHPGLPAHTGMAEESKGENLVSSSTAVMTKGERCEGELGAQSLPQTYRASPPLVPHTGPESLPHTAVTTVYATVSQPSYGGSQVHQTFTVAGHQSYISPAISIGTTDSSQQQMAYVSGSIPLMSVSSTAMTPADYVVPAEPIDFRRSSVTHASEVDRLNAPHGSDPERSGVSLVVGTSNLSVAPHCGDVSRGTVPNMDSLSRMTLPQTAHIGRMNMGHGDVHKDTIYTGSSDGVSGPQINELIKISASEAIRSSARNASVSVEAGSMNERGDISRKNIAISDVDRRSLPSSVSRGNSQESGQSSRMSMPSISEMSALDSETASLLAHESNEKVWITVPLSRHSVPFTDISKVDGGEGSRMTVSLSGDIHAMNALNTCEAGGIMTPETGNVRAIVMPQVDDFNRISLPHTSGVISTTQNDGSHIDTAVSQTMSMHGMDIKYSDIMARSGLADGNRIGILQTHGGYTCDDNRLSLSHLQEASDMSGQQAIDTKPIILPQTGDISIVAYPHVGEGVGTMALSQAGNISMVILPQTGDVGQMSVAQNDVRRIDLLPADNSGSTEIQTADGSRMNIQQNGNVIRISLPAPGDGSRLHTVSQSDGSYLQLQADMGRTILPQTAEVESKVDVSKLIVPQQGRDMGAGAVEIQQKYDVSRGIPYKNGGISSMRVSKVSEANAMETQQVYDFGAVKRQHMSDSTKAHVSQASDGRSTDRQMYHGGASILSQAGDIAAADRQRLYDVGRANASQAGDTDTRDQQQVYSLLRSGLTQAVVGCSAAEKQQLYDIARATITQAGDAGGVDRQQMYVTITDPSQAVDVRMAEASGSHRGSLPPAHEASLMRMHQAGDIKMCSAAAYMDSNIMTLPQTSGVRVVNIACAEDAAEAGHRQQPLSFDVKGLDQPLPEYNNIRVMAEAAEILSRGSGPADDINMRLMAETADFVSRNVPQATVINSAGSMQQAQDLNTQTSVTNSVARTADSSKMRTPQTDVSSMMMSKNNSSVGNLMLHDIVRPVNENKTVVLPRSVATEVSSANTARAYQGKPATAAPAGQKTAGDKWKQRAGTRNDKGKPAEQQLESGFRAEFLQSHSYMRWKDIGSSQALQNDEEIACFLMKYYDNTSDVFPSGQSTCCTCQQQLSVACANCPQKAAAADDSSKDAKKDRKKTKKGGEDNGKLWKLIVEAAPKTKGEERGKEDKTEKRHRRKPRQTRRVLRRRVIASPPGSSDEDSQDEDDAEDTFTNESPLPAKVHFEEGLSSTNTSMVTRKRGRPSNDSYRQAPTLECYGCQRKFHTAIGLDQHIKRKRCKASKAGASVSIQREPDKNLEKTPTTSFKFKCSDCSKEYRSKQGLMLHRVSKHGEANEKPEMAPPEEDDGDDTDEYVPDKKDSTPGLLECSLCHKQYHSKQGLLMHKASKHSEEPEKKIKLEKEGHDDVAEEDEDTKGKDGESFSCEECNKKYSSRPGYMLHMKTKHSPMIMRDCPECESKFKTKVELRIHVRREHHKGKLILFCPYCPVIFHNRDTLRIHMDELHKTCRRVLFDCVACDLQFSSRIERKRHIQSEHKGRDTSLTCHFCGSWFATRHEYDEHEKAGHPEQMQEWLCAICGDSLPTRYLLQRHALTHKEKILCSLCNKYITEPCFEDHMKRHYGNKTWKCEQCNKSFIRKAELQQHTLVHKNERPFCCELCGMRYREKSRLNSHMRTHSGIKPYKCGQCEKCFTRSRELKNHMRVHTGEKPFACTVCSRRFASSGNLSAHRRKVHKLEPIPHGQQSRKHTLEESIKPENKLQTLSPPPLVGPPGDVAVGMTVEIPMTHSTVSFEVPAAASMEAPVAHSSVPMEAHIVHSSVPMEAPVAHSSVPIEAPVAHSATSVAHSAVPVGEAPVAHSSAVTLQAPLAHQAPVAHQDQQAVAYQHHMVPKYEPLVTQPEHYIPQPVVQQSQAQAQAQAQSSLSIYWPIASYGEES